MKLIAVIREKEHFEQMLSDRVSEMALEFSAACSSTPIGIRQSYRSQKSE